VSADSVHPEVLAGLAAAAGGWLWACISRGQRPSSGAALAFPVGLLALAVATNGPLHDLAERSRFSAHMGQHLLLTLIAPPALLAGLPAWMVDPWLSILVRRPVVGRSLRFLTRPLPALAIYSVALVGWHLPRPFNMALQAPAWHALEHLTLLAAAVLGWWPVLSPSRYLPALPYGGQILYLFVFGMPMTVVAAMVTGAEQPLYHFYVEASRRAGLDALADQRLGGILMWVPAGVVPVVAFTVVFFRWAAAEEDAAFPK
jgi:putative membrane protein